MMWRDQQVSGTCAPSAHPSPDPPPRSRVSFAARPPKKERPGNEDAMKLLIVEDDRDYAATLREDLAALDHQVTVADNGRDALLALERDRYDAVILDRMLPQMEGAAVVRHARERGQTLPVLMLSALGRSVEKIDGLEAGADD